MSRGTIDAKNDRGGANDVGVRTEAPITAPIGSVKLVNSKLAVRID